MSLAEPQEQTVCVDVAVISIYRVFAVILGAHSLNCCPAELDFYAIVAFDGSAMQNVSQSSLDTALQTVFG